MVRIKIAPSILSADKSKLNDEVKEVEDHIELLHIDIMDGKFVPPTTFKPEEIKAITRPVPKDVHLMVEHPLSDGFIDDYIDAGAYIIVLHIESKDDMQEMIDYVKSKGVKVGITLNPPTPVEKIMPFLDQVDMALVMSVNPGYAGQKFIPEVLEKVKIIREKYPSLDIQIDGGIDSTTIKKAYLAGANVFVAGSAIFGKEDRLKAILDMRKAVD